MGKAVGYGLTLTAFLQGVVAHGFGRIDCFLYVAFFQQVLPLRVFRPNSGEAVGLQFEFYR